MLLVFGAALVVAGVALWSVAAALVIGGLMMMIAAVAVAAIQEARTPGPVPPSNGTAAQRETVG